MKGLKKSVAVKARIYGRVQGVWYRRWTEQKARDLGLKGWVKNRVDGSVEALFKGASSNVDAMLDACQNGPPNAEVDAVDTLPVANASDDHFVVK